MRNSSLIAKIQILGASSADLSEKKKNLLEIFKICFRFRWCQLFLFLPHFFFHFFLVNFLFTLTRNFEEKKYRISGKKKYLKWRNIWRLMACPWGTCEVLLTISTVIKQKMASYRFNTLTVSPLLPWISFTSTAFTVHVFCFFFFFSKSCNVFKVFFGIFFFSFRSTN